MSTDLSFFEVSDTANVIIKNPATGLPMDETIITIYSRNSKVWRAAVSRFAAPATARNQTKLDMEANDKRSIALLAAVTVGWSGIYEDKKPVEFSEKAAIDIYSRYPWLRNQLDEALADDANFLLSAQSN